VALDVVADAMLGTLEVLDSVLHLVGSVASDFLGLQVDQDDTVDFGRIRNEAVALCVVE
jgi:hypothetical protein